jgi:serine/threonine protein kinase
MDPERWHKIDELLSAVIELPSHQRLERLASLCGNDPELYREVVELLEADAEAGRLDALVEEVTGGCSQLLQEMATVTDLGLDLEPAPALQPGDRVAHFRILEQLGSGGMGEVYRAHDTRLDRKVALKVVRSARLSSDKARKEFLAEARTTARFNHPNIVTIYEVGEHQGTPYLALELLEGQTLRSRLVQEELELSEILRISLDVASALAEAHRHSVIHRDLKPANVFVMKDGRVRVLDFGLAKSFFYEAPAPATGGLDQDSEISRSGSRSLLRGTPAYMAPEQWLGARSSLAVDIWAFGMLMLELVLGRHPWAGSSAQEIMIRTCSENEQVTVPESLKTTMPELADLIEACLSMRPEHRPTAYQLAAVLSDLVSQGSQRQVSRPVPVASDQRTLAYSWLASATACGLALVIAVLGQALGAMAGGCSWIGLTIPVHRQPWALVNYPGIAFSHQPAAVGYWFGSLLLPLLIAAAGARLAARARSQAGALLAVQISWACAVIGCCWLPMLDQQDGHVAHWLYLHDADPRLLWIAPALALVVAMVPARRLLTLSPVIEPTLRQRLTLVATHLGLPIMVCIAFGMLLAPQLPLAALAAAGAPLVAALLLACRPVSAAAMTSAQQAVATGNLVRITVLLVLIAGTWLVAGRPLADGDSSGLLWSGKQMSNNVRQWVREHRLFEPDDPIPDPP